MKRESCSGKNKQYTSLNRKCAVCGEQVEPYDICENCGWQDDDVQRTKPDLRGGSNKISLNEAKHIYKLNMKKGEAQKVTDLLTEDGLRYIIERVLSNAKDAKEEYQKNKDDFSDGKRLAYYEILDTIKNELEIRDVDLKKMLLDINLDAEL